MRNLAVGAVVLLVGALWVASCYGELVAPYTWDDRVRAEAGAAGFRVFADMKMSELVLPWTLIWPYSATIGFVNPETIRRLANGRVSANTVWVRRDVDGRLERWEGTDVIDCAGNRFMVRQLDGEESDWAELSAERRRYFCNEPEE